MRGFLALGLLIVSATCGLSVIYDDTLTTTDAIVLIGAALAYILGAVAMGLAQIATALRQRIVFEDQRDREARLIREKQEARRG